MLKEQQKANHPRHPIRQKWWTEGGSYRTIENEDGLEKAMYYVREAQDRKSRDL